MSVRSQSRGEVRPLRPVESVWPMTACATLHDVTAYFQGKTEAILKRYGPGPRVHYHTGVMDAPPHQTNPRKVCVGN